MRNLARGYWTLTWLGLLANIAALPIIALVAFAGPPLQLANISVAIGLAWPAAIVGIVASSGLMAERRWGVVLSIVALSMTLTASLPYGIVRLVLVGDPASISGLSLTMAFLNLLALVYWCRPIHRKIRRL
tara:strand:+ start:1194 stop:1586 length:393 start_codon:yes stop_codon:yes gene_type:complete